MDVTSAGVSLRATLQYTAVMAESGAVYAAIIGILIPHGSALSEAGILALAIAPLGLIAAFNPNFRVARSFGRYWCSCSPDSSAKVRSSSGHHAVV